MNGSLKRVGVQHGPRERREGGLHAGRTDGRKKEQSDQTDDRPRPTDLQRATAIRGPESRSILFIRSKAEREGERREALARTHTRTAHVLFHPLTASVLAAISIAVVVASGGARI